MQQEKRNRRERLALPSLLIAAGVLLAWGTWRAPLSDVDEPRFAGASRQMVESGDWLHTYFNGEPRWQKPILFYWLQGGCFAALGTSEFAARIPAWLLATLTGLLLYGFTHRFWGRRAGLFALLVWMALPQTHIWAKLGLVDNTLTFLTAAAALAAFAATESDGRRGAWYVVAGVAVGLALLTKGPIGLLFPAGVYLCYVALEARARRELLSPWPYLCLVTALAVAVPWYALQYHDYGPVYLQRFLGYENLQRFGTTPGRSDVPGVAWWLFLVLALAFPCSSLLPWAVSDSTAARGSEGGGSRRFGKFLALWVALALIAWSLSAARHPQYIMAIYPAVAILCGGFFSRRWEGGGSTGRAPGGVVVVVGVLVGAGFAYGSLRFRDAVPQFTEEQREFFQAMGLLLAATYSVGALACAVCWRVWGGRGGVVAALVTGLAVSVLTADVILPSVVAAKDAPLWRLAVMCRSLLVEDDELIDCDAGSSLLVYYAEHVSVRVEPGRLREYLETRGGGAVAYVVLKRTSEEHAREAGLTRIDHAGIYSVWRTPPSDRHATGVP